jgi:hypothetical protein
MKKHIDGKCPTCGGTDLLFAVDVTEYSPVEFVDGKLAPVYTHQDCDPKVGDARLFCVSCGEYLEVPGELT